MSRVLKARILVNSTVEVRLRDKVARKQIGAEVARIALGLGLSSPAVRISAA